MSSMPERDTPGQWGGTQQSPRPGEAGTPPQGSMPGQEQYGSTPSGSIPGQPQGQPGDQPGGYGSQRGGRPTSPVSELETRVTGRRVVQYLIDAFLVSIIPSLVSIPFDRSSSTFLHIIGGIVAFGLFVLIGLWYWVIFPHSHNGQTFGMKLLGLRVISKDGGPANMTQLFIRWICLIFDAIPYTWPFTGLVGFIVILCSRHRQRIGDHLARTLVIETGAGIGGRSAQSGRSRSGQAGMASQDMSAGGQSDMGQPGMGQPGMGQPGMGQPGMGQPGMGQPGMGQPGTGPDMPDSPPR
jgi:uncharacterized RDD family membrane protein YckC